MAKRTTNKKSTSKSKTKLKRPSLKLSSQQKLILGSLLIILGVLLFISFVSFLFAGKEDQSLLSEFPSRQVEAKNWGSQFGAKLSEWFISKGFGLPSFIFSGLLFLSGVYVTLNLKLSNTQIDKLQSFNRRAKKIIGAELPSIHNLRKKSR